MTFLDECSRYLVHWELLTSMEGVCVSLAAAALEKLPRTFEGRIIDPPEIRSDDGNCYISREFKGVLKEHGLAHQRIKPHCPEENGLVEGSNRTLREALEETEFADRQLAQARHRRCEKNLGIKQTPCPWKATQAALERSPHCATAGETTQSQSAIS